MPSPEPALDLKRLRLLLDRTNFRIGTTAQSARDELLHEMPGLVGELEALRARIEKLTAFDRDYEPCSFCDGRFRSGMSDTEDGEARTCSGCARAERLEQDHVSLRGGLLQAERDHDEDAAQFNEQIIRLKEVNKARIEKLEQENKQIKRQYRDLFDVEKSDAAQLMKERDRLRELLPNALLCAEYRLAARGLTQGEAFRFSQHRNHIQAALGEGAKDG